MGGPLFISIHTSEIWVHVNMFSLTAILLGGALTLSPGPSVDSLSVWTRFFHSDQSDLLIPDIEDSFGAAFRDINHDGYPDLYVVCFRSINRLLINRGDDLGFRDETVLSGLGGNLMPMAGHNVELNGVMLDIDNDGDADVILAGKGFTTRLFRNEGNLRFVPDDEALVLPDYHSINQVVGSDVNLDGFIDLFFVDEELSNRLYLNEGGRRFHDVTHESGVVGYGRSFGAAFGDLNGDGAPDLYVANDVGPDYLYRNDGKGRFSRQQRVMPMLTDSLASTAVCLGDVDNDGDLDGFVAGPDNQPGRLFLNQIVPGDTVWRFEVRDMGQAVESWDGMMADMDNDGWQDLFVSYNGSNRLFANHGGRYEEVWNEGLRPGQAALSSGAIAGDYDRDGDLDLFVAQRDTFSLFYPNPLGRGNFLEVQVEGVRSNRDGIGARVMIYRAGGHFQKEAMLAMREIGTGGGYLVNTAPVAHFGLGSIPEVDVKVLYPSGREVLREALRAGGTYSISEYSGISRTFFFFMQRAGRLLTQAPFWGGLLLILFFLTMVFSLISLGLRRYNWGPLTATLSMAFYFFIAYGVILTYPQLGLIRVFVVINGIALLASVALLGHFERMLRLRRARARDRAVLVALSHEIVEIRDESTLARTVVTHLAEHSDFSRVGLYLAGDAGVDALLEHVGLDGLKPDDLEEALHRCKAGQSWLPGRRLAPVQWMLPVGRQETAFGLLLVGGHRYQDKPSDEEKDLFSSIVSQMAVALENIAYIHQSNEMIQKLTEAEVREEYLEELEKSNRSLDEKNQELIRLYEELKQAESTLLQREKMASLGQLVAGIAHELNNPVGFIYANIRQLRHYLTPIQEAAGAGSQSAEGLKDILPDLESLIDDTERGSQAVKALVENLRTFSHLDQAEKTDTDVHEGLETSLMIARPQLKGGIEVIKQFEAQGLIEAHPGQLNQVFLNLIVNAAQAMEGQGRLTLTTRNEEGRLVVEVSDTGPGIAAEVKDKIFDPFFSTKDIGQGMGMGLSISYAIIEKHNGRIEVISELGQGTCFRITLPLAR